MAYIWINPVAESMYEPDVLNEFLRQHGYKRFKPTTDWLAIVREKYQLAVEQSAYTVMDMRCPKIGELLCELGISYDMAIPDIAPILIHCGQEASEREDLRNEEKIITTPCKALADMGNALGLENTLFVPWNKFVRSMGGGPISTIPEKSPIPPGFFDELGMKTASVTGEEDIRNFLKRYVANEVQLVEMLFCKGGCHNGDGIGQVNDEK